MRLISWVFSIAAVVAGVATVGQAADPAVLAQEAYARWQRNGTATPAEKELMERMLFSPTVRTGGNGLDDVGGPDGFVYRWADNQNGDSVTFDWIELCADSLAEFGPTGDDQTDSLTWSFPFPFYGQEYTTAFIGINGRLTFQSGDGAWLNRCLSEDATQPTINVYWDDLVAQQTEDCGAGTPRIKYRDFGDYLVIEWNGVWRFPQLAERFTFEAILFASGMIKLQYAVVDCWDYCNSATAGIDIAGPQGLEYVCNGSPEANQLAAGRAVWFYPAPAASIPTCLVIATAGPDILLNWTALSGGTVFRVYRSADPALPLLPENLIAEVADTAYVDSGILDQLAGKVFYTVTENR